jgi:uncharacterized membrane protein
MAELVPSFDVVVPESRTVEFDRPWHWLAAGWRDLLRSPVTSLAFGVVVAITGALISLGLWRIGWIYLALPLASGFMIVAPVLAAGLYEVSRLHARGEPASFARALEPFRRSPRQLMVMGFILLLVLLTWVRLAAMIFMLYWGLEPPSFEDLVVNTFLRTESLPFLVFGTGVGAVFAAIAYAISATSIPMIVDRPDIDVITALVTSVRTVRRNPGTMLFWAVLIVAFTALGTAVLFVGLVVTMPLIGHASWHAYRDLVSYAEPDQRVSQGAI